MTIARGHGLWHEVGTARRNSREMGEAERTMKAVRTKGLRKEKHSVNA
jgi:hypothetical protein